MDQLLTRARAGRSGALVVRGEAGIGKTALVDQVCEVAASMGFRVESSVGVEAEVQFPFAALHQLCSPMLGRLDALPDPQQAALGVAFGMRAGPAPDRFLVGLATLSLVAEVAEDRPLLCRVDDAQWLDEASAQVLAFVARRVSAERVALVFGLRDSSVGEAHPFARLPALRLEGLSEVDARAVLATAVRAPLDEVVRDRIVDEARGNPLALLELPRGAEPAQLAGGFGLPDVHSVSRRIEHGFHQRSAMLPAESQLLLLVAAADPTGEVALLRRAAAHLGIAADAAVPAERAELLTIDTRVRFRHPLVRSAIYQAAAPSDRRRAHAALAAATDPDAEPDRRAWHRARAVHGTDEAVAAELDRSAGRARARGGLAAAAAFLQHATELTPEPAARTSRALQAAQTTHEAGAPERASELLAVAETGTLDALQCARVELLRARITFHTTRSSEVPEMLLAAASTLTPLDASLARDTYLEAIDAALVTGGRRTARVARAALTAPEAVVPPRPSDLLLDGLATMLTAGQAAGSPQTRRALEAFRAEADTDATLEGRSDRWLWLAGRCALGVLDDELLHVLASRHARRARQTGALAMLPAALSFMASVLTLTGELSRASELAAEAAEISEIAGAVPPRDGEIMLAAWRGDRETTAHLVDLMLGDVAYPDDGCEVAVAHYATAVLHNGLSNHTEAQAAAARACKADEPGVSSVGLPELVEAAVRAGRPAVAADAAGQLEECARSCDTPWALGLAARSRALTSEGPVAEDHYREAVERLGRSRMASETARAHLLYGEWLRREGRRQDAREELRTAHELLSDMGAEAFAERAARELRATGEHPRTRGTRATDALTSQEAHVARLVAIGATSQEVAAELFLSPRTVEAHLRGIFRKLGITSRRQLKELRLP